MKCLLIILFFLPIVVCSQLSGKVVKITDGDTFTILDSSKNQIRVRLHGIDCPERRQPFSGASKKFLSQMIYLKYVHVLTSGRDRYGRTLGIVYCGEQIVNEKMLAAGMAWHFKRYDTRPEWARIEEKARRKRIGLWKDNDPVPPWEWRKRK